MKKIIVLSALFVFALMSVSLQAQTEKKIVIKKKVVDANGNVSEEEIILEGKDAATFDMDKYLKNKTGQEIDINIEELINEGQGGNGKKEIHKEIRIIKSDGNQDVNVDEILKNIDIDIKGTDKKIIRIEIDGNDLNGSGMENMPEDVKKILEEKGIEINGNGQMKILQLDGENSFTLEADEIKMDGEKTIMKGNTKIKILGGDDMDLNEDVKIFFMDKGVVPSEDLEKILEKTEEYHKEGSHTFIWKSKKDCNKIKVEGNKCRKRCTPCENWETITKPSIGIMITRTEENKGTLVVDVHREDDILQKDDVITQFEKTEISSVDGLIEAVSVKKPGDKVKIKFLRNGKMQKAKIRLQSRMEKICADEKKNIKTEIIVQEDIHIANGEVKSDAGQRKLELKGFELFPNPSNGTFQLEFVSPENAPISIIINDAMGKEILRDEINDFNGNFQGEFNLKGNAPGVYFLNIQQNGSITTEKIILK